MKRDPLDMTISLLLNLNLLEPNEEYNINELKTLRNLDFHWNTILKYLKIFNLIKKYSPNFGLNDSKLTLNETIVSNRLNEKERLVIYLFNKNAINKENAIEIPKSLLFEGINESRNIIFGMSSSEKYYLTDIGLDIYRSIKQSLVDLIINEKPIKEIFPVDDSDTENEDTSEKMILNFGDININNTQNNFFILDFNNLIGKKEQAILRVDNYGKKRRN